MTSWVLTIASDYPEHWDIAKEHMLWDMTRHRKIAPGDVVYFWLAGHDRFIGRAEIAAPAIRLTGTESLPWIDGGQRDYPTRVRFSNVSDAIAGSMKWKQVQEKTGITQGLNTIPRTDDTAAEAWLASLFEPVDEVETAFTNDGEAAAAIAADGEDTRRRTLATIRVRRGQPAFRNRLLLLRSDIHTLFDLYQLTVVLADSTYRVRVNPDIDEATYRSLDNQPLAMLPADRAQRPARELLQKHNAGCGWLRSRAHIDVHLQ